MPSCHCGLKESVYTDVWEWKSKIMKVHTDLGTSLFIETEFNCVPGWPGTLCKPAGLQFVVISCHLPPSAGFTCMYYHVWPETEPSIFSFANKLEHGC